VNGVLQRSRPDRLQPPPDFDAQIGGLGGQLVAMVVTGLLVGVSMWLLGVPASIALGLIATKLDAGT
jgi:predicted PurR-regulated permease PerM